MENHLSGQIRFPSTATSVQPRFRPPVHILARSTVSIVTRRHGAHTSHARPVPPRRHLSPYCGMVHADRPAMPAECCPCVIRRAASQIRSHWRSRKHVSPKATYRRRDSQIASPSRSGDRSGRMRSSNNISRLACSCHNVTML